MYYPATDGGIATFWDFPKFQVANNSRAGSVSIQFAMLAKFGRSPAISGRPTKEVFLLVRDPVERFISAMNARTAMLQRPVSFEEMIEIEVDGSPLSMHLQEQSWYRAKRTHLYRFPDHLVQFSRDTGLGKLPVMNQTIQHVTKLTASQKLQVEDRYKQDRALFNQSTRPGRLVRKTR